MLEMIDWLRSWGQKIKQHPVAAGFIMVAIVAGIALIVVIVLGYQGHWEWTGLNGGYSKVTRKNIIIDGKPADADEALAKTLWDWLQLAIVPLVLAGVGLWFTQVQKSNEQTVASDNQHEKALQDYIDKISELLLNEHLGELTDKYLGELTAEEEKLKPKYKQVRNIARVRTITVLTQLDARRIGYVFAFLREAGLMSTTSNDNVVNLGDADLRRVNWSRADLRGANLSGAYLVEANLSGADLREANLSGAYLHKADLSGANLVEGNLSGANLYKADLRGANLSRADLVEGNLSGAYLVEANLSKAYLRGANLGEGNLSGANLYKADLRGANLSKAYLRGANLGEGNLSGAYLVEANLSGAYLYSANLSRADLSGADLTGAKITPKQLEEAKNVIPEQLAQIKPSKLAAPQAAQTEQVPATPALSETKPDQTSQEEAEQQEHTSLKQDTDAASDRADGSKHP